MADSIEDEILERLRRMTRAIAVHSKQLAATFGLTAPQLVCLRTIGRHGHITPSDLARKVSLSQATVTGIVARLAARQLVTRRRPPKDRRQIHVAITKAGADLIAAAPSPLQERFVIRLATLSTQDRESILNVLDRVVRMMDGLEIDGEVPADAALAPVAADGAAPASPLLNETALDALSAAALIEPELERELDSTTLNETVSSDDVDNLEPVAN